MMNLPDQRPGFAQLRIMKELNTLPPTCEVTLTDASDLTQYQVAISPETGLYQGGRFMFSMTIPGEYPFVPPKIKCTQTIYHPNIDLKGNICLNILREEWTPALSIEIALLGLLFLFLEPNPKDPLNHEAAAVYDSDKPKFEQNLAKTMSGRTLNDVKYDNVLIR